MAISKYLPLIYFILGIVSAVIALNCSLQDGYNPHSITGYDSDAIKIAAGCGALGFSFLSGVCFFCCAYLSKKNHSSQGAIK